MDDAFRLLAELKIGIVIIDIGAYRELFGDDKLMLIESVDPL